MVEDLHDLLARDHLLDVAIKLSQSLLLLGEEALRARAREADIEEDHDIAGSGDEREPPVEDEEEDERAHHLDASLHHGGKAVVQGLGDSIHIVREEAHRVTRTGTVEPGERQVLHMREEIAAHIEDDLLRCPHHGLRVAHGRGDAQSIDDGREDDEVHEAAVLPCRHGIHDRLDHVRAEEIASTCDGHEHGDREHLHLCMAHVSQKDPEGMAEILRTCRSRSSSCHLMPPFRACPASGRAPDRSGLLSEAPHACRSLRSFRHPISESCLLRPQMPRAGRR